MILDWSRVASGTVSVIRMSELFLQKQSSRGVGVDGSEVIDVDDGAARRAHTGGDQ